MRQPVSRLADMLGTMHPVLHDTVYVFACVPRHTDLQSLEPLATFHEEEGLTLIIEEQRALKANLPVVFRAAWITLSVHSDLQGVGLTAAVSTALAHANISCNIVAAVFHDHLFVPVEAGHEALAVLQALQSRQSKASPS
ncbi:MAG: ACT domain-containing protein [Gemmatimonadaceae bacterium]|nr:ACT domain-containing protein [Gemmatimonadaceae bacterium]